jgi:hypothetical protein
MHMADVYTGQGAKGSCGGNLAAANTHGCAGSMLGNTQHLETCIPIAIQAAHDPYPHTSTPLDEGLQSI